jgi:hypothetical protein
MYLGLILNLIQVKKTEILDNLMYSAQEKKKFITEFNDERSKMFTASPAG